MKKNCCHLNSFLESINSQNETTNFWRAVSDWVSREKSESLRPWPKESFWAFLDSLRFMFRPSCEFTWLCLTLRVHLNNFFQIRWTEQKVSSHISLSFAISILITEDKWVEIKNMCAKLCFALKATKEELSSSTIDNYRLKLLFISILAGARSFSLLSRSYVPRLMM